MTPCTINAVYENLSFFFFFGKFLMSAPRLCNDGHYQGGSGLFWKPLLKSPGRSAVLPARDLQPLSHPMGPPQPYLGPRRPRGAAGGDGRRPPSPRPPWRSPSCRLPAPPGL